jgi:hypothetical protein
MTKKQVLTDADMPIPNFLIPEPVKFSSERLKYLNDNPSEPRHGHFELDLISCGLLFMSALFQGLNLLGVFSR